MCYSVILSPSKASEPRILFHITFYVRRCLPFGEQTKMSSSETFSRHALLVVSNTACAYFLLLVYSIKHMHMLDTCRKEVNYHWFSCDSWRPRGARHVWGAFGKMSRIDCRRFLRSSHPLPLLLILRTLSQFRSFSVIFGNACYPG